MTEYFDSCIAIGNFDGIHTGHDILIRQMLKLSEINNLKSMILTFKFSDSNMRKNNKNLKYIMDFDNKMKFLQSYGADYVCYVDLNSEVSKFTPERFIKELLVDKYHMKHVVVGYNFNFGYKASGNTKTLEKYSQEFGYKLSIIDKINQKDGSEISSTIIRKLIQNGNINKANEILVRNFTIFADEIEYLDDNKCIITEKSGIVSPCDGIYPVRVGNKELLAKINTTESNDKYIIFDSKINRENIVFLGN